MSTVTYDIFYEQKDDHGISHMSSLHAVANNACQWVIYWGSFKTEHHKLCTWDELCTLARRQPLPAMLALPNITAVKWVLRQHEW